MASITLQSNASGTGTFTVAAPNSNTNRTLTLPDETGTVLTTSGPYSAVPTAPVQAVYVDSSGNVGIGTNSPVQRLHIKAPASSGISFAQENTNGLTNEKLIDWFNNGATYELRLLNDAYSAANSVYQVVRSGYTVGYQRWLTGSSSEAMRIDSSGNVGIGTTAPGYKFTVAGTTNQIAATTGTNELLLRATSTEAALYTFQAIPLIFYTNNAERMRIDSSGNLLFNSGYGSVATAYGCRAWVNFNGTLAGPITPRASGNVSSVTKNGTGDYTINFTTTLTDANYAVIVSNATSNGVTSQVNAANSGSAATLQSTSAVQITHKATAGGSIDCANMYVAVFR